MPLSGAEEKWFWGGGLRNIKEKKKKGKWIVSYYEILKQRTVRFLCLHVRVCVRLHWENMIVGRGEILFLLSSYVLQSSCMSQWVGKKHEKRKEGWWYPPISAHALTRILYRCAAARFFTLLFYILARATASAIVNLTLWLTVTSARLLLSACLHSYLWNDDWAQDS